MKEAFLVINIVCWNIQYGQNFNEILFHLKNSLSADIYMLQEVDKNTSRTNFQDVANDLASSLHITHIWSREFRELSQGSTKKTYTGQAILSKFKMKLLKNLYFRHQPISWSPSIFNPRSWFEPRYGKRMAQIIEIIAANQKVIIANTHLESSLTDDKIAPQMKELLDYLNKNFYGSDIIIAGDLNTWSGSDSPVIKMLRDYGFRNAYDGISTGRSLDWIFYRGNQLSIHSPLKIRNDINATDHHPLQVSFKITPR